MARRYKTIPQMIAERNRTAKESSAEFIEKLIKKNGVEKASRMISTIIKCQVRERFKSGVKAACGVAEVYDAMSSHPNRVSDCIMKKLNCYDGKVRVNPVQGATILATVEKSCVLPTGEMGILQFAPTSAKVYKMQKGNTYQLVISKVKRKQNASK